MSCENGLINSHTLYQYNESSYYNDMSGNVSNGDVIGVHGSMKFHSIYQHNGLI